MNSQTPHNMTSLCQDWYRFRERIAAAGAAPHRTVEEEGMLFEQLVKQTEQEPEYDWDGYYHWLYSELAGHDIQDFKFWICKKCMTVNVIFAPARYGKCRDCNLIYMA